MNICKKVQAAILIFLLTFSLVSPSSAGEIVLETCYEEKTVASSTGTWRSVWYFNGVAPITIRNLNVNLVNQSGSSAFNFRLIVDGDVKYTKNIYLTRNIQQNIYIGDYSGTIFSFEWNTSTGHSVYMNYNFAKIGSVATTEELQTVYDIAEYIRIL